MTDQLYNKPIPKLDDPDMAPFWAAAREGRLTAQRCTSWRRSASSAARRASAR